MTREEIETAAKEFVDNYGELKNGQWCLLDFAIQQVNAALEECENAIKCIESVDGDDGDMMDKCAGLVAIRALRIE